MLLGDGRCALIVQCSGTTVTSLTVRVQQSTLTNSGFADISGASVALTTDGIGSVSFDRDYRYLKAVAVIVGTTGPSSAMFVEQLKQVGG